MSSPGRLKKRRTSEKAHLLMECANKDVIRLIGTYLNALDLASFRITCKPISKWIDYTQIWYKRRAFHVDPFETNICCFCNVICWGYDMLRVMPIEPFDMYADMPFYDQSMRFPIRAESHYPRACETCLAYYELSRNCMDPIYDFEDDP